jgi:hypothetical protein
MIVWAQACIISDDSVIMARDMLCGAWALIASFPWGFAARLYKHQVVPEALALLPRKPITSKN